MLADEQTTPLDIRRYLQAVVATARQGRHDQPLGTTWDAAEEAAVVLLRSEDPAVEARYRLSDLLRADRDLRAALRRYVRERAGTAWPEPLPATIHRTPAQLDIFDPPSAATLAPSGAAPQRDPPGSLLGIDEPAVEILRACIDLASQRLDRWQKRVLTPWLRPIDHTTLARARVWAEVWLRGLVGSQT